MIPKIIHYCWFGGEPLPEMAEKCIASWRKYNPGYQIKRWDENNFDLACDFFPREAHQVGRWAFVSDYARLKIIYENGGIYLDTDVEVIKSLDELLSFQCFLGAETDGYIATGLGFGAEKGSTVVGKMLDAYKGKHFQIGRGVFKDIPCPEINTPPLIELGYSYSASKIWSIPEVTVFPPEYFCPVDYITGATKITDKTYSIHHFSASWVSEQDIAIRRAVENARKNYKGIRYLVEKQKALYKVAKEYNGVRTYPEYLLGRLRVKAVSRFKGW